MKAEEKKVNLIPSRYSSPAVIFTFLLYPIKELAMKSGKILLALFLGILVFLTSCNRFITPFEAANGKARCGRGVR